MKKWSSETETSSQHDMLLLTLPYSELEVPPCGPAVLKGIAESAGYSIKIIDTNIIFLKNFCNNDPSQYFDKSSYWLGLPSLDNPRDFYQLLYDRICNYKIKYLGISVFSVYAHIATYEFLKYIKDLPRDWEIVVGGKGLTTSPFESLTSQKTLFYQLLSQEHLYDKVLLGDSEDAIIDLLDGSYVDNLFKQKTPTNNKLTYPFSNFDDYNLMSYGIQGAGILQQLPVYTTKGCVRACDFCDVAVQFGKFQQKDAQHLADEMIFLANRHGIYSFASADSIANGSMRSVNEFIRILAKHNKATPVEKRITWNANWIARPRIRSSAYGSEFYKTLKDSGCTSLTIGAEAGSDHVLLHMNKKTDVDGLLYELEQLGQVGIQSILNIIVGHWSERYEDFLEQLVTFVKFGPKFASGDINLINLSAFSVLTDTPSSRNSGLQFPNNNFTQLHWHPDNSTLTYKEKMARLYCLVYLFQEYNIPFNRFRVSERLVSQVGVDMENARQFFKDKPKGSEPAVALMDNIIDHVDALVRNTYSSTCIKLELDSYRGVDDPIVSIKWNSNEIYIGSLPEGRRQLEFDVDYDYSRNQEFSMQLLNKTENDITFGDTGDIVRDKYVAINSLVIDQTDIVNDKTYLHNSTKYLEHGEWILESRAGLWTNYSKFVVEFNAPFWRHYLKQSAQPLSGTNKLKHQILNI